MSDHQGLRPLLCKKVFREAVLPLGRDLNPRPWLGSVAVPAWLAQGAGMSRRKRGRVKKLFAQVLAVLALLLSRGGPARADIVFSTFGPDNSFDPNRTYEVINQPFPPALVIAQAMAFTPLGSAFSFDRIEMAVAATNTIGRLPALDVSLARDAGGVPGPIIETLHISDVTVPGIYSATSVDQPSLKEGTRYWLIAQADVTTEAQWFFNSVGEVGMVATRVTPIEAWSPSEAPQGAFRIYGTPVPVPGPTTLLLLGIGTLGLIGWAWGRKSEVSTPSRRPRLRARWNPIWVGWNTPQGGLRIVVTCKDAP